MIQHLLGIDRNNPRVSSLYLPHQPAIIAVIQEILFRVGRMGKPVSICGEMARNPFYVYLLSGLGLREFSMAPAFIPLIKEMLRHISLSDVVLLADEIMNLKTAQEIFRVLKGKTKELYPLMDILGSH